MFFSKIPAYRPSHVGFNSSFFASSRALNGDITKLSFSSPLVTGAFFSKTSMSQKIFLQIQCQRNQDLQ